MCHRFYETDYSAHKEIRVVNSPFPYEESPRTVMGVELPTICRICNHAPIFSKWPFLYTEMVISEY